VREERRRRRRRLVLEDVEVRAADAAVVERGDEGGFVDDAAARRVDQDGAALERVEEAPVDEARRFGRERHVERHVVRARQRGGERSLFVRGGARPPAGEARDDDAHVERGHDARDRGARRAAADDRQRLARELARPLGKVAEVARRRPAGRRGGRLRAEPDRVVEEARGDVLRDRRRRVRGHVADRDAARRARREVHVVRARRRHAHEPQRRRGREHRRGDLDLVGHGDLRAGEPRRDIARRRPLVDRDVLVGRLPGARGAVEVRRRRVRVEHDDPRAQAPVADPARRRSDEAGGQRQEGAQAQQHELRVRARLRCGKINTPNRPHLS